MVPDNAFKLYPQLTTAWLGLCLHAARALSTSEVSTVTQRDATNTITASIWTTEELTTTPTTEPPTEPPTTGPGDTGLDSYAIAAIVVCSILGVLIVGLVVGKVIYSRTRGKRHTNVSSENLRDAENGSDRQSEYSRNAPVHFSNTTEDSEHPASNGFVRCHPSLGEGPLAGSTHKRDIPTDLKEFLHAFLEDNTAKVVHAKLRLAEEDDIEAEAQDLIPHASVLLDAELQDRAQAYFSPDAWRLVKALLKNLEAMINDNTLKHSKAIDTQIGTFGKGKGKGKSSRSVSRSNSLQSLERNNNDINQPIIVQHM